jgi:drug/metabolite transporter (DMT)-like permease
MKGLKDHPLALLIGTGLGLGLNFPLGKAALAAGFSAPLWAAYISMSAGLALQIIAIVYEKQQDTAHISRFAFMSGFLSYVMPNLLTFTVIPKLGSGFAGLMFALSPVTTALLSLVLQVRPPNRLGLAGIGLGLVGALAVIWGKGAGHEPAGPLWLALGLLVPCFLAVGNVYRTTAWPKGAGPILLGSVTNLAAVPFLLAIAFGVSGGLDLGPFVRVPWLPLLQLVSSTLMFTMFFRLQRIGGPTYLSQIGYVAAGVGLFFSVVFMGESYAMPVWLGAAVIVAGVAVSTWSARRP